MDKRGIWMPALGRKRALAQHLKSSISEILTGPEPYQLLGTDASESSPNADSVDFWEMAPMSGDDFFLEWANGFCQKFSVTHIVPTRDAEMALWARWKEGSVFGEIQVIVSNQSLMKSWFGKEAAAKWLDESGLPHPGWKTSFNEVDFTEGVWIAKPTFGSASRGVSVLGSREEAEACLNRAVDPIGFQHYITGPEYTVNLYFDPRGQCQAIIPHQRIETLNGEVSRGVTVEDSDLLDLGNRFARATYGNARGPINFQAIRCEKTSELQITDINPRFGGGYPLTHKAGGRFTDWLCQEFVLGASGRDYSWRAGVEFTRA
ncbi:MAG: ATP-grasp domain-containing protein [Opitutales bacterium]